MFSSFKLFSAEKSEILLQCDSLLNANKMCQSIIFLLQVRRILFSILDKLQLCLIISFIPITKKIKLCVYCKENLYTDTLAEAERVSN